MVSLERYRKYCRKDAELEALLVEASQLPALEQALALKRLAQWNGLSYDLLKSWQRRLISVDSPSAKIINFR
ncbi:MAG: hypothetical protein WA919_06455 [Coleofasciculaceae cyanobacterium]